MKKFKGKYFICEIQNERAMEFVEKYHYLHRPHPCSFAFGLFEKDGDSTGLFITNKLVGVVTYGTPPSPPLRSGICGKAEKNNVIELARLCIFDDVPKNAGSFLIGNTVKKVDKEIIVSFADSAENHIGYVYQASNWIYTGTSFTKIDYAPEMLEVHKITFRDKYSAVQMREMFGDKIKKTRRSKKHRYIFFNCGRVRKNYLKSQLKYKILPYPKQ